MRRALSDFMFPIYQRHSVYIKNALDETYE